LDDDERKAILQKFIDGFGEESIRFVRADSEFCSKEWLSYLIKKKISYWLRIKANYQITNSQGEPVRVSKLFRTLKINERRELKGRRKLRNNLVYEAVCKKQDEAAKKPLKTKKHRNLEKSIFRLGFEKLTDCFCQITANFRQKQRFQQLTLFCPVFRAFS
jgi:Transposase DDE domain